MRELNPPFRREGPMSCADRRTGRQWVVKELNLSSSTSLFCDNGFTGRREEHNPQVAQAGVEPAVTKV